MNICELYLQNRIWVKRHHYFFFLLILAASCSTKNKGFLNRAYHNTTARYNGFFNAKESIKEGLRNFKESREENYDDILPIFPFPDQEQSTALFPEMNRAIEKTEKVITRHSMEIGGKEYCRWIDNNYLAKGIAHHYKREFKEAISTFSYISKKYKDEDAQPYALGWLVRSHLRNDELNEASVVLPALNKLKELKRKPSLFRQKVNADYHIARGNYLEAIDHIQQAISLERKRKNKVRLYFIMAQLHQRLDNSNEAIAAYRYVAKKSPDYDLAFNAGISQATAVKGSANSFSVKKDLQKLLKDDKNIEYHDQIYYALAEISFTEREYEEAVDYLKQSIDASINNNRQKGKSFYRLARYYFGEKRYQPASTYYDSSVAVLPNSHPEYDEIKSKAKNLKELVVHLNKIDLNDSLLVLANMDPLELDDRINEIIQQERERILREQRQQELKAQQALKNAKGSGGSNGSWYFYNSKAKQQGFKEFKDRWGDRPLQDNWRRSQKGAFAFEGEEGETEETSASGGELAGLPSAAELREPIPQTTQEKNKLTQETKYALYQSGLVYKENFQDYDNAIEAFENLLARYDTTTYRLPSYYQLYRLYLLKENQKETEFFSFDSKSSSFYYKDLILYEYPESEFAQLIKNPEGLKKQNENDKDALRQYQKAYLAYQIDSLDRSIALASEGIEKYSRSTVTPKFYFLQARAYGELKDIAAFEKKLAFVAQQYPSTEEGKEAKRMLDLLRKALASQNQATADSSKTDEATGEPATANAAESEGESPFIFEPSTQHFYMVCIPKGSMNTNRAKVEVSNFNGRFFANKTLNISLTFLSNELPILIVKGLSDKDDALVYHSAFINDNTELRVIARNELDMFPISKNNFKTLFLNKDVEAYKQFFDKNYIE